MQGVYQPGNRVKPGNDREFGRPGKNREMTGNLMANRDFFKCSSPLSV